MYSIETRPPKWTGKLVGDMHLNRVTRQDIADELGVTKAYISYILNGTQSPKDGKQRVINAYQRILEKRSSNEC